MGVKTKAKSHLYKNTETSTKTQGRKEGVIDVMPDETKFSATGRRQ